MSVWKKKDTKVLKSFDLKDELNPKIWEDKFKINESIRAELMEIANDYYNSLEMKAEIYDVILTGSLVNYNYSEYSDYDLHILIDYKDVNPDVVLVEKFLDANRKLWNTQHNISIRGYEVEIYVQDKDHKLTATGIFSLLKNRWVLRPKKEDFKPDTDLIKIKSEDIMEIVASLKDDIESDNYDYNEFSENLKKVWEKIKHYRKSGLENGGELSTENLVFKFLRRNGTIQDIMDLRRDSYDMKFESIFEAIIEPDDFSDLISDLREFISNNRQNLRPQRPMMMNPRDFFRGGPPQMPQFPPIDEEKLNDVKKIFSKHNILLMGYDEFIESLKDDRYGDQLTKGAPSKNTMMFPGMKFAVFHPILKKICFVYNDDLLFVMGDDVRSRFFDNFNRILRHENIHVKQDDRWEEVGTNYDVKDAKGYLGNDREVMAMAQTVADEMGLIEPFNKRNFESKLKSNRMYMDYKRLFKTSDRKIYQKFMKYVYLYSQKNNNQ
jgi:hypothetical protein